jgi:hypothetical protein
MTILNSAYALGSKRESNAWKPWLAPASGNDSVECGEVIDSACMLFRLASEEISVKKVFTKGKLSARDAGRSQSPDHIDMNSDFGGP